MAGITIEVAEAQLSAWIAASTAAASGQSYEIEVGGSRRKLTRADAAEIRAQITFWDGKVKQLSPAGVGGRRRTTYVVPE